MPEISAGLARSRGSTCTMTSYCSPWSLKRVTWRPPSMDSSVRPTTSTPAPTSAILSRSTWTRSSGVFSRKSGSRVCSPAMAARRAQVHVVHAGQFRVRGLAHDHAFHRLGAGRLPEGRRIGGKGPDAGQRGELRLQLARDLLLAALALLPGFQAQDGRGVADGGIADRHLVGLRLGNVLVVVLDVEHAFQRVVQGGALGRDDRAEDHAAVLDR